MPDKYETQRLTRDIKLRDVPLTIDFCYSPDIPSTDCSEGVNAEIDVEAVWLDGFDIYHLCGSKALFDIEEQLWEILNEGESV